MPNFFFKGLDRRHLVLARLIVLAGRLVRLLCITLGESVSDAYGQASISI
jgi:hypothetical protein